jgi:hypothetical protein
MVVLNNSCIVGLSYPFSYHLVLAPFNICSVKTSQNLATTVRLARVFTQKIHNLSPIIMNTSTIEVLTDGSARR